MQCLDAIILGDGIVARTLSLACSSSGLDAVRVGPEDPSYEQDPRTYAISPSNLRIFEALGQGKLKRDDVSKVAFGFGQKFVEPLGLIDHGKPLMHMIDHNELAKAMKSGQHIADLAGPVVFDESGVTLPKHNLRAGLLVIAEGKFSKSAKEIGISYQIEPYNQMAVTARFRAARPHQNIARQLFTAFGPLGILPHAGHDFSIVWSQDDARAKWLMALGDRDFSLELQSLIGAIYGELTLISNRFAFPLVHGLPSRIAGDRFVLCGDSAHAVHPLAGQGLNLGLRDVAVLIDLMVAQKRLGLDVGSGEMTANYAARRKADIAKITHLTKLIYHLAPVDNPPARGIKSMITKSLSSNRFASKWLAELSDTPLHPQPALLKGLPA